MIDPINITPVMTGKRTKHGESYDFMMYCSYQVNRKAKKKKQPLWCRDYKKVPRPLSNNEMTKPTGLKRLLANVSQFFGGN